MHLHKNTVLPVAASQQTFVTEINLCTDLLIFRQPVAHVTVVSGTECKIANVIIPFFFFSLLPPSFSQFLRMLQKHVFLLFKQ